MESPVSVESVKQMYLEGWKLKEIAKILGMHDTDVSVVIKMLRDAGELRVPPRGYPDWLFCTRCYRWVLRSRAVGGVRCPFCGQKLRRRLR